MFFHLTYRKDRNATTMEGVLIAIKACYTSNELPSTDEKCKIVWAQVHLEQAKDFYMGGGGAYYRQPNAGTESIDNIHQSIQSLSNNLAEKHFIHGGDFNVPDIDLETCSVQPKSRWPQPFRDR